MCNMYKNGVKPKASCDMQLASENGGAGDGVGLRLISIISDTWITRLVCTGEGNQVSGNGGTAAADLELMASGIELDAWV